MKSIFYDISDKIDSSVTNVILDLKKVSDGLSIPFIVIGATARDVLFEHIYNMRSPRRTLDIDLGIRISDWGTFETLSEALIATRKFSKTKKIQRFTHNNSTTIDIVPFGAIADKDFKITWPPEHEMIMSTLGFEEVFDFSIIIRISKAPELDVRFPAIPGIAIMKILSWHEKYPERAKDAEDLLFIMKSYEGAGNRDRLYTTEGLSILKEESFDTNLASIRLLGQDMAKISSLKTLDEIKKILISETSARSHYRLASDMRSIHDDFDDILLKIEKLKNGMTDPIHTENP